MLCLGFGCHGPSARSRTTQHPGPPGARSAMLDGMSLAVTVASAVAGCLAAGMLDRRIAHSSDAARLVLRGAVMGGIAVAIAPASTRVTLAAVLRGAAPLQSLLSMDGIAFAGPEAAVVLAAGAAFLLGQRLNAVGITGGISSGKSALSAALADQLGEKAVLLDADEISHRLQSPGTPLHKRIVRAFGEDRVCDDEGRLDRRKLGLVVFRDDGLRRQLNALTHPAIGAEIARQAAWHGLVLGKLVVIDAALLLASPALAWLCWPILVVTCDPAEQRRRLEARDPDLGPDGAAARIAAQPSAAELLVRAGWAGRRVRNDGSVDALRRRAVQEAAAITAALGL